jgi:hypothetical protein
MPVEDVRELAASDVPERNETIAGAIRLSLGMPAIAAIDDLFERARLDGDGEGDSPSSSQMDGLRHETVPKFALKDGPPIISPEQIEGAAATTVATNLHSQ